MSDPSSLTAKNGVKLVKKIPQVEHVQVEDPFPIDFLRFLLMIPCDSEAAEPPQKRRRIECPEAIPIAKHTLSIRRPIQPEVHVPNPIARANAHYHLKVIHKPQRTLTISSVPRSSYGTFRFDTSLSQTKFSENLTAILEVLSRSKYGETDDGALWVSVMVELERNTKEDEIRLYLELNWNSSTDTLLSQRLLSRMVINTFFGGPIQDGSHEKLSPRAFYDAAFISKKSHSDPFSLTPPRLTSTLFPFQRRALQWLLNREGVEWRDKCANGEPGLEQVSELPTSDLPFSFKKVEDANGQSVYMSDLYHVVNRDIGSLRKSEAAVRGGILAEEMGLGKTVEAIALICTHTRKYSPASSNALPWNGPISKATLIVTPLTLKNQWISEFDKHAPHLNVMVYDGLIGYDEYPISELAGKDVVITTYTVLQSEFYYAEVAPVRFLRHAKRYERPKAPLAEILWWRVCLDEAQQIESGVSNAARVARMIPRINSWGITGTPVKENIKDLWGLLVFLRCEPFASSTVIWEELITSHKHLFGPLFNRIALRHTKRAVRNELTLPQQNRYVITVPFTTVEEQRYKEQFSTVVRTITQDETGESLRKNWNDLNSSMISLMQRALAKLRQATLHPSLGPSRLLGGRVAQKKALRTVDEVLDAMVEQSELAIRMEQRNLLLSKLKVGQILEGQHRINEAIHVWKEVLDEVEVLIAESRKQLQEDLDKAKQTDANNTAGHQNDEDADNEGVPGRIGESRRRLRAVLDIYHRALFFIASGYYQLKTDEGNVAPHSKEYEDLESKEVSGYEAAKRVRQEILHEPHAKVMSSIAKFREMVNSESFVNVPNTGFPMDILPDYHELESLKFLDKYLMLTDALNSQYALIDKWRKDIVQMLIRPLVDQEGEAEITGDEYEDSAKLQDELMVYTLALRAIIADRQDAISGLQNERIKYDTRFAERQAKDGQGHAPEKVLKLLNDREKYRPDPEWGSYRGFITNLRELATKLRHEVSSGKNRARMELEVVEGLLRLVQDQSTSQSKAAAALESELNTFVAATNARVEYYKQLQGVSDTVAPLDEDKVGMFDLNLALGKQRRIKRRIDEALPQHRYLLHLREAGQRAEEVCVICQCPFVLGVLTPCGHQFCKECILYWFKTRHNCPVCKTGLVVGMLHDITLKKPESRIRQELPGSSQEHAHGSGSTSSPSKSRKTGIYCEFGSEKLEAIKSIELPGPRYSTKIDTLAKHLMWLRVEDPGAKSVIFSQFPAFLELLADAFDQYKIGRTSFKMRNGIKKFKEDPAVECFLMDARAHASGLNLINASHVFLCEPLLNTALELQAIARVDRIGQEHDTTVWLYLIDGTVEESIYNLSVQRRLEQLGSNGAKDSLNEELSTLNLEAANSRELEQAELSKLMNKDVSLGEVVPVGDLWQCLFGHIVKDKEREADADDARTNNTAVMEFLAGDAAEARHAEAGVE